MSDADTDKPVDDPLAVSLLSTALAIGYRTAAAFARDTANSYERVGCIKEATALRLFARAIDPTLQVPENVRPH